METKELIGKIAGIVVLLSAIPYIWRIYQGKTKPNVISWAIWSLIGFSILATYKSNQDSGEGFWPSLFGFTNPICILAVALWRRKEIIKLDKTERRCFILGMTSLALWLALHYFYPQLEILPLYLALIADGMGMVPTVRSVRANPESERPCMWIIFAVGYGLSIFAVKEYTIHTLLLPIYMVVGPTFVFVPLIRYRIRNKVPLKEWF